MQTSKKNAAVGFIFVTILLDVVGWGIIIPVTPKLIQEFIRGDISVAATYGGWLFFSYSFMQFLFASVMGSLSDRYGRRRVILISLVMFSMNYLIQAFATSLIFLFVGRILAGMSGATITAASAYIADISTEKDRAKNFGMVGAAFGVGFIIGPVLGGILGEYGSRVPFFASAVLCFINAVWGVFVLPESLPKEKRRAFDWKRANPVGSLMSLMKYKHILSLAGAMILMYIGANAVQANWTFYTMYLFQWSEKMVGYSLGLMGLMTALVQGLLIRWIQPKVGNQRTIIYGLSFSTLAMLLFSFAQTEPQILSIIFLYGLGGLAGPGLQSLITGQVLPTEQGEIQGALTSLVSLTSIIGPPLMNNTFYFFTHENAPFIFPGAPFFLAFILFLTALVLVYFKFKKKSIPHNL